MSCNGIILTSNTSRQSNHKKTSIRGVRSLVAMETTSIHGNLDIILSSHWATPRCVTWETSTQLDE